MPSVTGATNTPTKTENTTPQENKTNSQSSSDIKMNYMKLLVTQLKHQNPLDPMKNDQMTQQLTGLSQLENIEKLGVTANKMLENNKFVDKEMLLQLQKLNNNLGAVTNYSKLVDSTSMIGKTIEYKNLDKDGKLTGDTLSAKITSVTFSDGKATLNAGDKKINIGQILKVVE